MKKPTDILDHLSNMLLVGHLGMIVVIPMFLIERLPGLNDQFGGVFSMIVTLAFVGFILAGLWWLCRLIQVTRATTGIGNRRALLWLNRASVTASWIGFIGIVGSINMMVLALFYLTVALNAEIAQMLG
jgi:hypothetical protein